MPSKAYVDPETAITWTDTGGDAAFDLGGLASKSVRVGAQYTLPAAPRSYLYLYKIIVDGFDTAPVVGQAVHFYLAQSTTASAAEQDGDVGTSDAAGSVDDLPNLTPLRSAIVQTTTAADELITSGVIEIFQRYVSPVCYNATDDALLSTSDSHQFILTPIPIEGQ
jgi:hypothetical protein